MFYVAWDTADIPNVFACLGTEEMVSGRSVDIWAIGVVLYCLVVGTLPFSGKSIVEMFDVIRNSEHVVSYLQLLHLLRVNNCVYQNSPVIPDNLSPSLRDLIRGILVKDPNKRLTMDAVRVSGLANLVW